MSKRFSTLGILSGILLVAACSTPRGLMPEASLTTSGDPPAARHAKESKLGMRAEHGQVNAMDRHFVTEASNANLEEVALGMLGQQKGHTESVKAFGKRMETDHSKSEQELKTAAQEAGLTTSMELSAEAKATMERLSKLSGMEFDREYMKVMVKGHEKAIKLFTMESEKGSHPAVKGYATKTLPTLHEHLKLAESVKAQLR